MPEARDRVSRPVDIAAAFARRRSGVIGILADEPEGSADLFQSPMRLPQPHPDEHATPGVPSTIAEGTIVRTARRAGVTETPRILRGRYYNQNSSPPGSVRRGQRRSMLPVWHPRTPLRDITAIVRAIERRRALLREGESPMPEDRGPLDPSHSEFIATRQKKVVPTTPYSAFKNKRCPNSVGKVPKILLGITNQSTEGSDCLTPQKKLLNSIDSVEKVVMEELQNLKKTPTAKKAEREKRVRTLMTMR